MSRRLGAAIAGWATIVAVALVLVVSKESSTPTAPRQAGTGATLKSPATAPSLATGSAREDCSTRSEANFPGAFTDRRNLVVGPLVLVGGAHTDASTVREFGGNKFPLLVEAGHVVTLRLAHPARDAGLAYGPLPQGATKLRDTHQSVTFVACPPGRPSRRYSPYGPSGSQADGTSVTFWSGFVLTRAPACLPLEIYVDDASARRVGLPVGRRCDR